MKGGPQDLNGIMTEDKKILQQWSTIYQKRFNKGFQSTQEQSDVMLSSQSEWHLCFFYGCCDEIVLGIKIKREKYVDFNADRLGGISVLFSFSTASVTSFNCCISSTTSFPLDKPVCVRQLFIRTRYAHITVASQ